MLKRITSPKLDIFLGKVNLQAYSGALENIRGFWRKYVCYKSSSYCSPSEILSSFFNAGRFSKEKIGLLSFMIITSEVSPLRPYASIVIIDKIFSAFEVYIKRHKQKWMQCRIVIIPAKPSIILACFRLLGNKGIMIMKWLKGVETEISKAFGKALALSDKWHKENNTYDNGGRNFSHTLIIHSLTTLSTGN